MVASWQEIEEFPGYLINEYGDVMSDRRKRIIRPRLNNQGFLMVGLCKEKEQKTRAVAPLVAERFLPPKRNEAYNSIIHLNGDRSDCRSFNLMWRPRWFAIRYHQMFEELPIRVSVVIRDTGEIFSSLRELCTTYGLIENYTYNDMNNGERVYHYGFFVDRY